MSNKVYIGYDRRERTAWEIARSSLLRHCMRPMPVIQLCLEALQVNGFYLRPTARTSDGTDRLIDRLSWRPDYPGYMSTGHAIARFFVPKLAREGWALFMDGDMLVRGDLSEVFQNLDPAKALYCVKHDHNPMSRSKMDNQLQTRYARKNWSSFMIFNCDHVANALLFDWSKHGIVNSLPGRDLHAFSWLKDELIGELDPMWNYLVEYTRGVSDPKVVHFTEGLPDMPGYKNCEFADEWFRERERLGLEQKSASDVVSSDVGATATL